MEKIRRGRWREKGGSGERVWKRWLQVVEEMEIKEPAIGGRGGGGGRRSPTYPGLLIWVGFFFFLESSVVDSYRSLEF